MIKIKIWIKQKNQIKKSCTFPVVSIKINKLPLAKINHDPNIDIILGFKAKAKLRNFYDSNKVFDWNCILAP